MTDNRPLKTYVVEGTKYGEFPLDMLRRDDALPYGEENAKLVDRLNFLGDGKDDLPKKVRVTLCSKSKFAPLVPRWESFGWKVVECSDPTVILSKEPVINADDLRQRRVKAIGEAVVKLQGHVHAANPTYDAIRYAGDVAGQDAPYRQHAIGFCEGVDRALGMPAAPGLLDRSDIDALRAALSLTRRLLMTEGAECMELCNGDEPTIVCAGLLKIEMMFK